MHKFPLNTAPHDLELIFHATNHKDYKNYISTKQMTMYVKTALMHEYKQPMGSDTPLVQVGHSELSDRFAIRAGLVNMPLRARLQVSVSGVCDISHSYTQWA